MTEANPAEREQERFDAHLKGRTRRSIAWMMSRWAAEQGLSFIMFVLMARTLPMAELGTMAIAFVFLDLGRIITTGGLTQRVARTVVLTPSKLDTIFWLNMGTTTVFCLAVLAAARPVAASFAAPHLEAVLAWSSLAILFSALGNTHLAVRLREFGHSTFAIQTLVAGVASAVVAVVALLMGAGIWAFVIHRCVREAIASLLAWRSVSWRPRLSFDRSEARSEVRFGSELAAARLVNYLTYRVQDLILGRYLGPVQLSSYRVAFRPAEMLGPGLAGAYGSVALQTFSRLQNNAEHLRSAYTAVLRQCALLCVPALVGYAVAGPWLVPALFGAKWETAGGIAPALMFLAIPFTVGPVVTSLLTARGHAVWQRQLAILDLVSTIVVAALTLGFGLFWVTLAYSVRACIWVPLQVWLVRKAAGIGFRDHLRTLWPSLVGSAVMAAIVAPALTCLTPGAST